MSALTSSLIFLLSKLPLKIDSSCSNCVPTTLVFDYFVVNQSLIKMIQNNYSRIRDYHNEPPLDGPMIYMSNIIAKAVNLTLVSSVGINSSEIFKLPRVMPTRFPQSAVQASEDAGKLQQKWVIIQDDPIQFNFLYCDHRHKPAQHFSIVELFASSADEAVWACLFASIAAISLLLRVSVDPENGTVTIERKLLIMAIVSALLSPGTSSQTPRLKYSLLFALWMCVCLIFVTYWTGAFTSEIISPAREARMTKLEELAEANYTLIYELPHRLAIVRRLVEIHRIGMTPSRENSGHWRSMEIFWNMLRLAWVTKSQKDFVPQLATGRRLATVADWPTTIFEMTRAMHFITNNQKDRRVGGKKCYIGEQLIFHQNLFYIFLSPGNLANKMGFALRCLQEGGIYERWYEEFVGIASSRDVQGRVRLKSKTKLSDETEPAKALDTEGKLKNVFLLWAFCVVICLLVFWLERVFKRVAIYRRERKIRTWFLD